MLPRIARPFAAGLASFGLTAAAPSLAFAQAQQPGIEVLARGPVHEAFASTLEYSPNGGPIIGKRPPDPIEELPPDQKPDGENVQWIPGYWQLDEEKQDFIWISGFWRQPPPGRMWVPGGWREAQGGWQWVHGFWQAQAAQQQQELQYLPQPPAVLDVGPSVPAPSETHQYVPGCWVWHRSHYAWRPGVWVEHRPGWLWTPAHYRWTPAGYVFVDGYWDYPLADRGILFSPVYVSPAVYSRPQFVYTPSYYVAAPALYTSLFVRRGWGNYYFGDYYEPRYADVGYTAWCGSVRTSGFAISVSVGRGTHYDPLWDYYRVEHRNDRAWSVGIGDVYAGRYAGTVARPPRTLVQQQNNVTVVNNNNTTVNNTVINNITNNNVVVNNLSDANRGSNRMALKPVAPAERVQEQQFAQQVRGLSQQRRQVETKLADKNPGPVTITAKPQTANLEVPKTLVTRAQVRADQPPAKAPPPSLTPAAPPKPTGTAPAVPAPKPNVPTPPSLTPAPKPSTSPQVAAPTPPAPKPTMPATPTPPAPKPNTPIPPPAPKPTTLVPPPAATPPAPKPPVVTPPPPPKPNVPVPPPVMPVVPPKPTTPPPAPMSPPPAPKPNTPPAANPPAPKPGTPPPAPKPGGRAEPEKPKKPEKNG